MQLYTKILDASLYVESCQILEQVENQKILVYISTWLDQMKKDIDEKILPFYLKPSRMTESDNTNIANSLKEKCEAFREVTQNFQYVPIQPPFFTLKTTVEEITLSDIPDEMKIRNIIFKNIPEFNFTESLMKQPGYERQIQKDIDAAIGSIPVVHSMTVTYHCNPLMWPLIFHEYGHTVFNNSYTKSKIERKIKEIRIFNTDTDLRHNSERLLVCISEVYSDLFALNYHSKNYFFAFYFHEMLCSDINGLFNLDALNIYKGFQEHPPSIIRMKYMHKEIKKKKMDNDKILKKLFEYNKYLLAQYPEKIKKIPQKDLDLYDLIYEEMSSLFEENVPHKFDQKQINTMYTLLKDRWPIGTLYKNNPTPLKTVLLKKGVKDFDVDSENKIIDIIYTGWQYLILHLYDELYANATEVEIKKFSKDYNFFMKNICYSIETSVIVSSYMRNKNVN
jgi:hypothetical protein